MGGGGSVLDDRVPEETVQKLIYHDRLGEPHSAWHLDETASSKGDVRLTLRSLFIHRHPCCSETPNPFQTIERTPVHNLPTVGLAE